MPRKKFIKNLYQILCAAIPSIVILVLVWIIIIITTKGIKYQDRVIILSIIGGTIFLGLIIGCYWMFQTIVIDENGIQVKFLKKILRKVKWDEVEDIICSWTMRSPIYRIKVKESNDLNLDRRKKIKNSIMFYGDESIKEVLKNLQK
ncbi:MAG: hypothetical protein K2O22_00450 [Anaeroplasmataceae bacterium]|nr:hypothetical protein [Anaeroplasmataceae bacterium]